MHGQSAKHTGQQEEKVASPQPNFPALEETVLARWRRDHIFEQTLEKTKNGKRFVFFEGPPTANGMPHIGHVETRAFKDVILRFKTMQGFFVERKAGWDTQGLPVELEVEKQLGVAGKKRIEAYGIAKFNEQARASVWQYKNLWEKMSERIGFWLDFSKPYITYTNDYIESLWWILRQMWEQQLLEQDFKVVPYCPRCETALSSHEVAQGYQQVTEPSLYVKFELAEEPGTFLLAWTTTPWTLPGNVALAVNPNVEYWKTGVNKEGERFIIARDRADLVLGDQSVHLFEGEGVTCKGSDLVGQQYTPLFDFLDLEKESGKKAYSIVAADFVSTTEGTGIVHTAVMYGEDDFQLGRKLDLPTVHTVDGTGRFNALVTPWKGLAVKDEKGETQKQVAGYLRDRNLLFKEALYTHDYPFCWRCKHPLLYYAKTCWFIRMSRLRQQLLDNNQRVHWHPDHIKEGRFGEWLREVKDWAVSRERFWGTPLPIWCCDACDHQECLGSMRELADRMQERSRNTYVLLRHGDADTNATGTVNAGVDADVHMTDQGRAQIRTAAEALRGSGIDLILSSDLIRTKETAAIVGETLGLDVQYDARLREMEFGSCNGRTIADYFAYYREHRLRRLDAAVPGGETLQDIRRRLLALLRELETQHQGKRILLIGHGDPFWVLRLTLEGYDDAMLDRADDERDVARPLYPERGVPVTITMPSLPRTAEGVVDLHRPFVDQVAYPCARCHRGTMHRVPEVADTWFDSGSMPFAQWHYPFGQKERIDPAPPGDADGRTGGTSYPADYITEAVDQTRGWFYVLLAVATVLQQRGIVREPPYRNVLVLGHIRDAQGRKLSKSLGNYLDPMELIREFGADAIRFYLLTINQPWESKNFDAKGVADILRKHFRMLWNVIAFLDMAGSIEAEDVQPPLHVLDAWLTARTQQLVQEVTRRLEALDVTAAGRELAAYANDLSTWYVRRSRDRLKTDRTARAALAQALRTLSVLHAPFTPFFAELLYERVRGPQPSVHLAAWPAASGFDAQAVEAMANVRRIAELGHALREAAKIRVRQPLPQAVVVGTPLSDDAARLLQDELNVKSVVVASTVPTHADWRTASAGSITVALETTITDALRHEGWLREAIRVVNDLRKQAGLTTHDRITVRYATDDATLAGVLEHYRSAFCTAVRADVFEQVAAAGTPVAKTAAIDGSSITLAIERA